jgi:ubiquinone/menaquinone biosynthesis C-methylase UbiE
MKITDSMTRLYFDLVYNRVYDFTTARLDLYQMLQQRCVQKIELKEGDKVLCVGIGTGNEISHILKRNDQVEIIGIDYSTSALLKAQQKAAVLTKKFETYVMDARRLNFDTETFDKAVCIHVMDFLDDNDKATMEIFRVLKPEGEYIITYPSDSESKLGSKLLKDVIRSHLDSGKHRVKAYIESIVHICAGLVYLPILTRPNKKFYSRSALHEMISRLDSGTFNIYEEPVYQDFIVHGKKG